MTTDASTPSTGAPKAEGLPNPSPPAVNGPRINGLRASVRPVVTYALTAAVVCGFGYSLWRFETVDMATKIVSSVLDLTFMAAGLWFGSRQKG